jgi:hypothetical protein
MEVDCFTGFAKINGLLLGEKEATLESMLINAVLTLLQ